MESSAVCASEVRVPQCVTGQQQAHGFSADCEVAFVLALERPVVGTWLRSLLVRSLLPYYLIGQQMARGFDEDWEVPTSSERDSQAPSNFL